MAGGLIGICQTKSENQSLSLKKVLFGLFVALLMFLLCSGIFTFDISKIGVETNVIGGVTQEKGLLLPNNLLILLVVCTCVVLLLLNYNVTDRRLRWLSAIGKRSYSIFVWHQVFWHFIDIQ